MRPFGVVKLEVLLQSFVQLNAVIKYMDVYTLVLDTLPQPFDEDVVNDPAYAIHAEGNGGLTFWQQRGVFKAGELAALVGVDDFGLAMGL